MKGRLRHSMKPMQEEARRELGVGDEQLPALYAFAHQGQKSLVDTGQLVLFLDGGLVEQDPQQLVVVRRGLKDLLEETVHSGECSTRPSLTGGGVGVRDRASEVAG